jgi:chromosome segregation ATPase
MEAELRRLSIENNNLSETVKNLSHQLDNVRKECSSLEARILVIQQDRHDTQARLKFLYGEKEQLENNMEGLRNELNMKEIYIRQLTRHNTSDAAEEQRMIQSLSEENKRLIGECTKQSAENEELRRQCNTIREHYETCLAEVNGNVASLEAHVSHLNESKRELESAKYYMEEQLSQMRRTVPETTPTAGEQVNNTQNSMFGHSVCRLQFTKQQLIWWNFKRYVTV